MDHRLALPAAGPRAAAGRPDRLEPFEGREPENTRAVFVYGRLNGLARPQLLDSLVKSRCIAARSPARAALVVLAHEAAGRCIGPTFELALPFAVAPGIPLLSENGLRRLLGLPAHAPPPSATPYRLADVARLSGLSEPACETLRLFDVIAPGGGAPSYADLATARQVGQLLGQGVALPQIVGAAAALGRRGLRVSHVRLVEAPWGIAERCGTALVRLDGQFALVLDEEAGNAEESFWRARESEEEGDFEAAERWYRRAERLDRSDPVIAFNLGNVLAAQKRGPEAIIAYRRALDRDRSFAEASFNLARLYEDLGRPAAALPWYRGAIAAHPAYAQALYNAARLLTGMRRFAEALPLWTRFVALAPDDPDIGHARRLALLCRLEGG
jgi:tetratricopeptide (TPR) repeat protein